MPRIEQFNSKLTIVAGDYLIIADSEDPNGSGYPRTKKISPNVLSSIIDHTQISNIGTNSHTQIDTHIADNTLHASPTTFEQAVIVNSSLTEVTGKIYNTWSAADTYIQTQTPAADNRWSIIIHGENSENIIVKDYVSIVGIKGSTVLSGALSTSVSASNATKTYVYNCNIQELTVNSAGKEMILIDCELNLSAQTLSSGTLHIYNSKIFAGTFSSSITINITNSDLHGGTFQNVNFYFCNVDDVHAPSLITFVGGKFYNCKILGGAGVAWTLSSTTYEFYNCDISTISWTLTTTVSITFVNSSIKTSTVDIPVVPSLFTTKGCLFQSVTISGAQVAEWVNVGDAYDNSTSTLAATDIQGAIDEVVSDLATAVPLTLTSAADGFTIAGGTASRTLTVTSSDVTLNQDLQTSSSPSFNGLTITTEITANGGIDVAAGNDYQINNVSVLNATTLGSSVVNSSLTSVGTLTELTVDNININGNTITSTGNLVITATDSAIPITLGTGAGDDLTINTTGIVYQGDTGNVGIGLDPTANMSGLSIEAGILTLKETTTPTADSGYAKIYSKSDNLLYFQDGGGTENELNISIKITDTVNNETKVIDTIADSPDDALKYDYYISDGTNSRMGLLFLFWNGTTNTAEISDVSSASIGDTSDFVWDKDVVADNVRLKATATNNYTTVKLNKTIF